MEVAGQSSSFLYKLPTSIGQRVKEWAEALSLARSLEGEEKALLAKAPRSYTICVQYVLVYESIPLLCDSTKIGRRTNSMIQKKRK